MTRYTGYSQNYHDAGLSIINEDGTIEFASHAERFDQNKNTAAFSHEVIAFLSK